MSQFGSLGHAWLYAKGVRIVVDSPDVRLPDGKVGEDREAKFVVSNLGGHPVQILGVKTN